ncbi:MAG: hypothetical protein PHH98_02830 [Candidatus Gracilibacteria bacterium]|nr:hypothetical protein [Candidatus Gracilibacteria bacterium]
MSKFIEEQVKKLRESQVKPIKSKVMFNGDFLGEMEKLIEKIEIAVEKEIAPNYGLEYLNFGNTSIKIKINDKTQLIEKLITCNFAYNNVDERYGYIDPQFLSAEMSKKTKVHNLGKFPITEHEKIVKAFIKMLVNIIEEY